LRRIFFHFQGAKTGAWLSYVTVFATQEMGKKANKIVTPKLSDCSDLLHIRKRGPSRYSGLCGNPDDTA